ncbi:hypothetical protein HYW20_04605 [Candidatus Woesearchaeota archaeon]|nr:hypothetical protein [Candidatus Woesearchaeota archaeon]
MKKLVVLVLFIMATSLVSAAVSSEYYGESPKIIVSLANQDPDPVEPGKIVEVSFKMDNQGTLANNVVFDIEPEYPFSLLPGEAKTKILGTLGTSQNGERTVFVKYKLKVDQNAVDGSHEIKVRYKTENFDLWNMLEDLIIKVQSKDAILSVEKYTTTPEVVAPGSKAKLMIGLRNHASSILKDVKITLDLGKSGDEQTPFAPVGSTNEKVISVVDAQGYIPLEFSLMADPDAKSKVYKVPLKMQYSDIINKNYSKTLIIAVVVGAEPDISVYIDSTKVYTAGKTGEVTVKIVNKGLTDVKFLNVNLDKADGYKVLSPYEVYLGNIDSDDYETADFKLGIDKTSKGKTILPLTIEYKDANNADYKKKVNLELPIYTSSEAKRLGLVEGNGKIKWIIVVIVIVGGFFGYRMWRKKHRK